MDAPSFAACAPRLSTAGAALCPLCSVVVSRTGSRELEKRGRCVTLFRPEGPVRQQPPRVARSLSRFLWPGGDCCCGSGDARRGVQRGRSEMAPY